MTIRVECSACGKKVDIAETLAGKIGECPACGTSIDLSAPAQAEAAERSPTAGQGASLKSMKCESCGGAIQYQEGQGLFKCRYCGSVYESESAEGRDAVVTTIRLVGAKLDRIESDARKTADIASEERLWKKAALVQDRIDFKYIEFQNSSGRKAGSAAIVLWIFGAVLLIFGHRHHAPAAVIGLLLIAAGVALFLRFRKAKARFEVEAEEMKRNELEPLYDQLRRAGAALEGGAVSLGFTESTSVPMRYCVCCHKNVTPTKGARVGGGFLTGVNLALTIVTCGLWIPAWILIAIISKAGSAASRAVRSGRCPECGTTTLFPARIPNA